MINTDHQLYFARGPFCWGQGDNIAHAINNCRREWPRHLRKYDRKAIEVHLFLCEDKKKLEEVYIDDLGGFFWPSGVTKIRLQQYPEKEDGTKKS